MSITLVAGESPLTRGRATMTEEEIDAELRKRSVLSKVLQFEGRINNP